jgi:hypothetical protein
VESGPGVPQSLKPSLARLGAHPATYEYLWDLVDSRALIKSVESMITIVRFLAFLAIFLLSTRKAQQSLPQRRGRSRAYMNLVAAAGRAAKSVAFFFSKQQRPSGSAYLVAQHFLYFRPLPQGHRSLRPAFIVAGRNLGAGSRCRATSFASGARLCRKKRFNPAHR